MNIILIEPDELDGGRVVLRGRRADHIRKVLRGRPGDTVRVGILDGPLGEGRIRAIDHDQVELVAVDTPLAPPPAPAVDLVLALPRPIMLRRTLAQAVSLGVGRIFLINANRVEKSYFSASALAEESLESALRQGLEQAIDTRRPQISIHRRFRPFVEDLLPPLLGGYERALVAHPEAAVALPSAVGGRLAGRALLAIGPEGGWVDFEIDRFVEQGFRPFTLGPRILRVDTAVPALLAQLELLRLL